MNIIESLLLVILAFLPPIIYVVWIRNTEKFNREKWFPIFICFIWGASIAVVASIILELILDVYIITSFQNINIILFLSIVIIAPLVEEFTKPFALRLKPVKRELDELEDGLIYGAVAGLGFSATENLLYGWSFLSFSLLQFFVLMLIRSFGACLLHASATALTGYGYGKSIMGKTSFIRVIPFFFFAFLIHAIYNFLLTFDTIGLLLGLFLALVLVSIMISFVRNKIKILDKMNK